jgi:predicted Zn finger-like uncharacterized protein
MDVRCEKCQTEYELDESRLKPGGVTVKCTNCGHMFKIRKRTNTNVGVPAAAPQPEPRSAAPAKAQPRAESVPPDAPLRITDAPSGPNSERQWLIRLENGETKTCRELATLQQWIVAGVVSRESLISRSGKTWKRLGDIAELSQYFVIADEARAQRAARPTAGKGPVAATMLGVGRPGSVDDEEGRTTGNFRARPPTPPPPPPVPAPASTAPKSNPVAIAQTELAPSGSQPASPAAPKRPPPPPRVKPPSDAGRQTAMWANHEVKASDSMAAMPQGPSGGKLQHAPEEPAFAGRVRMEPSTSPFDGRVRASDDDDEVFPAARGSRAGMWIALISLLVIGAAAGAIYMLAFKGKSEPVAQPTVKDAAVAPVADAAQISVTPVPVPAIDAGEAVSPLDTARGELLGGVWARMKTALDTLKDKDDPASLAMRARLATAIAQAMQDRAGFVDKAEADKLRKDARQAVIDAAPLAQRAVGGQADSASANLAMADIMRLQGKPAPAVKRYLDVAKAKAAGDKELMGSVALAEAQLAMRDGKLPEAEKALAAVEAPEDMRIKLALAQVWYAQNKAAEAKGQVDQVLATQPDNDVALAMYKKLETTVAKTDPLPPEDGAGSASKPAGGDGGSSKPTNGANSGGGGGGGGGGDYDSLLAKANKLAETNCSKAMELYMKALEQRPNGVEALTGMGYCHLDAKQFSSAFSKFRAALAVSPRFEPALSGVAETYQRQGNKEAAIEAWRKYLDVYPNSAKAKKQLEILGASDEPKEPPKEQPKEPPKEAPPPPPSPPPPAPTPGSAG